MSQPQPAPILVNRERISHKYVSEAINILKIHYNQRLAASIKADFIFPASHGVAFQIIDATEIVDAFCEQWHSAEGEGEGGESGSKGDAILHSLKAMHSSTKFSFAIIALDRFDARTWPSIQELHWRLLAAGTHINLLPADRDNINEAVGYITSIVAALSRDRTQDREDESSRAQIEQLIGESKWSSTNMAVQSVPGLPSDSVLLQGCGSLAAIATSTPQDIMEKTPLGWSEAEEVLK